MGTKTIICMILLASNGSIVESKNVITSSGLIDNIGTESVSRLYRNLPQVSVYASATPYGAYSFNAPSFIAPKTQAVQESGVISNTNSYLKDSYGNQFVETPQATYNSYRNAFPQQYVQLQNLPAHLSQALVSPAAQLKQSTPHFFAPGQYSIQNIQNNPSLATNRFTVHQPLSYGSIQGLAPNSVVFTQLQPQAQYQFGSNKNVYSSATTSNNYKALNSDPKYKRLQDVPHVTFKSNENSNTNQQTAQSGQSQQLQQPKQSTVTTLSNGQQISLNLVTKPPVPLLDLSLLEPLTFANPLVPQVQHYLPRINQAIYHKLPDFISEQNSNQQNQNEFDDENIKSYSDEDKPKITNSKKKQKKIVQKHQAHDENEAVVKPTISVKGTPNEGPEFSFEIKSPNYKETYTEKKISYNKESETEPKTYNYEMKTDNNPVHYSFEKNTRKKPIHVSYETHVEKAPIHYEFEEHHQKEPITYSYVKTSKKPTSQVNYENKNSNPNPKVHKIKSQENEEHRPRLIANQNSGENSDESYEGNNKRNKEHNEYGHQNHGHHVHYYDGPKTKSHNPEHRQVQYYHTTHKEDPNIIQHQSIPQSYNKIPKENLAPVQQEQQYFQPIIPEYEENIRILPTHKPHDNIRVDPSQHIPKSPPPRPQSQPSNYDRPESFYSSAPIVKGTPKQTHSQEESAEDTSDENDQLLRNMYNEQEKDEENFEKNYKNAAYGFPAYGAPRDDGEKDIYNPETYVTPRYYSEYNVAKSPFEQYEAEGDGFPKFTRLDYKDARDKMQEDYYLDFAVSKPKSLQDRFRMKESYYTLFKKQRPVEHGYDNGNKQGARYTSYDYVSPEQKQKQHYGKHEGDSDNFEYDYSNEQPHDDTSAHATRPHHRYRSKTQFVEPQFQYGFEPISLPQLLDSELSAMASSNNPKSEKQSTRKKIYKENLFIKKTTTKGAKNSSS